MMSYHIKLICIFLHVMIAFHAVVIQSQGLHQFVVQLSDDQQHSNWFPLENQLNQRSNGIYTYTVNHGGNVKIASEFCFKAKHNDATYKIDFLQNGNTYPVYAMQNGVTSIMPEYEVEKKASKWQIKRTGMSQRVNQWNDISSVIHQSWQVGSDWQQEMNKIFDDSQTNTNNQICYYSATNKYFNVAFYQPNILKSFANYNNAFKTGLDQCLGNNYIAVQWSEDGWNKKRPICIRKSNYNTVGVRDPVPVSQQSQPQQLRFIISDQSNDVCASRLQQCQTQVRALTQQQSKCQDEKRQLIQDNQECAAKLGDETNRLTESLNKCRQDLLQDHPEILETVTAASDFVAKNVGAEHWPTSWNNILHLPNSLNMEKLSQDMSQSYAVFHVQVIDQIRKFIAIKIRPLNINKAEKEFYKGFLTNEDGTIKIQLHSYVDRLLATKSMYFTTTRGKQVYKQVGAAVEQEFKNDNNAFNHHLTYEEMRFVEQSVVSSPTQFINDCQKGNQGNIPASRQPNNFYNDGVFVGILGPKLDHNNNMAGNPLYADQNLFFQRLETSLELFLFEANRRGKRFKKPVKAYINGMIDYIDDDMQVKFIQRWIVEATINMIKAANFEDIDAVQFAFESGGIDVSDKTEDARNHEISVSFGSPVVKQQEYLLVAMYAGNSNTLPGNTFWRGEKAGSNEIDAAVCSTITFTQNPFINPYFHAQNAKVFHFDEGTQTYKFSSLPEEIPLYM